jgi:DNA/RNA-binding domain of Phe-tRNA-synthetase-like protein
MCDAVVQSRFRYGRPVENYGREIVPVSALENAKKRMEKFDETGNINYLVDAANFLMYEFLFSKHPKKHYDRKTGHGDLYVGMSKKQMLEFENKEV